MNEEKELLLVWGTTKPVTFFDNRCQIKLQMRGNGEFSYYITDKELYNTNFNGDDSQLVKYFSTSFETYFASLKDLKHDRIIGSEIAKSFKNYINSDASSKGINFTHVDCRLNLTDESNALVEEKEKAGLCGTTTQTQDTTTKQVIEQNKVKKASDSDFNVVPLIVILIGIIILVIFILNVIKQKKNNI